jgi:hypothetical protein
MNGLGTLKPAARPAVRSDGKSFSIPRLEEFLGFPRTLCLFVVARLENRARWNLTQRALPAESETYREGLPPQPSLDLVILNRTVV